MHISKVKYCVTAIKIWSILASEPCFSLDSKYALLDTYVVGDACIMLIRPSNELKIVYRS